MQPKRLKALTGLRFFAALAVIFRHFGGLSAMPEMIQQLGGHGFLAVSFFYVLSGFVLTYSYAEESGRPALMASKFYWARFARIYPAYLLAAIASAPLFYIGLRAIYTNRIALTHLVIGGGMVLALLQSWVPGRANFLNSPAWSVSVEAFFYLLFPRINRYLRNLPGERIPIFMASFWLASVTPSLLMWVSGVPAGGDRWSQLLQCWPIFRVPEFMMGCLMGRLFLLSKHSGQFASLWASVSAMVMVLLLGRPLHLPEYVLGNGLFAPLFCALIWFSAQGGGLYKALLGSALMVFLGEISYSIYILQEPVARWYQHLTGHTAYSDFYSFLTILILCSTACYLLVEKPIGRAIRDFGTRLRQSRFALQNAHHLTTT